MKKKIMLVLNIIVSIYFCLLVVYGVERFVVYIRPVFINLKHGYELTPEGEFKFLFIYPLLLVGLLFSIVVFVMNIVLMLKGSNASNFVRYTYGEYKTYRVKKKEEKQANKKAKLQEKIDKMEKTE